MRVRQRSKARNMGRPIAFAVAGWMVVVIAVAVSQGVL